MISDEDETIYSETIHASTEKWTSLCDSPLYYTSLRSIRTKYDEENQINFSANIN